MSINSFFGSAFCINMEADKARLERFTHAAGEAGIAFERFEAVRGVPVGVTKIPLRNGVPISAGHVGCIASHLAIIQRARAAGWPSVLIFEDDAVFHPRAGEIFDAVVSEIPTDWDLLYLGGHHRLLAGNVLVPLNAGLPVVDASNRTDEIIGLYRSMGTKTTHGYGIAAKAYDLILENIDLEVADAPIDVMLARLHPRTQSFCIRPHIAWQANGFSSTEEREIKRENTTRWG